MKFGRVNTIVTEQKKIEPVNMFEDDIMNAFKVLSHDEFFKRQFSKIYEKLKDGIISFRTIPSFTTLSKGFKNLERLQKSLANYNIKLSELQNNLRENHKIINRNNLTPSEKNQIEMDIAIITKKIQVLKSQKRREKNITRKGDYEFKIEQLELSKGNKTLKYQHATLPSHQIERIKAEIFDLGKRITKQTSKIEKITLVIDNISSNIENVSNNNMQLDDIALQSLLDLIQFTSKKLLSDISEIENPEMIDILEPLTNQDDSNVIINYLNDNSDGEDPTSTIDPMQLKFMKLRSILKSIGTNTKLTNTIIPESFDNFYNTLVSKTQISDTDFKIDTMEILSLIKKCK